MRTILRTRTGVLELNWTWLPTWVGMNTQLKKAIETELSDKVKGKPMTEAVLDEINDMVIDLLERKVPHVTGLRDYLDGLKFVTLKDEQPQG